MTAAGQHVAAYIDTAATGHGVRTSLERMAKTLVDVLANAVLQLANQP